MDVTMEKKLREMIDRDEIWQVLLRYGRGLDRFDRELVRSCYFDDAIDDHDTFVGGVEDFIDWANETSGYFVSHHHGVMNHSCELDGDDAYCETYFLFTGVAADASARSRHGSLHRPLPAPQPRMAHREPGLCHRRDLRAGRQSRGG